jgi:hypothetical protein
VEEVHYYTNSQESDKTDCSNYCEISLLLTSYKILSTVFLSRLNPYMDEIIGDHQCFNDILHSSNTGEKKMGYKEAVHKLFLDFKKTYDSFRRELLYNILIEFGIPMKLVRLIKICLKENYI